MKTKSYGKHYNRVHDVIAALKKGPLTYASIAKNWDVSTRTAIRYIEIAKQLHPTQVRTEKAKPFVNGSVVRFSWIPNR